jgi:hypothetical protein
MMFLDTYIDAFQRVKKTWIDLYVKEPSIANPMNEFVDAQTEFAKNMTSIADKFVTAEWTKAYAAYSQPTTWFGIKPAAK